MLAVESLLVSIAGRICRVGHALRYLVRGGAHFLYRRSNGIKLAVLLVIGRFSLVHGRTDFSGNKPIALDHVAYIVDDVRDLIGEGIKAAGQTADFIVTMGIQMAREVTIAGSDVVHRFDCMSDRAADTQCDHQIDPNQQQDA